MAASQAAGSYGQPAYKNKKLSPEARARDLLSRMNLDEKVMQTQCLWIQKSAILNKDGDFDETKAASVLKKSRVYFI